MLKNFMKKHDVFVFFVISALCVLFVLVFSNKLQPKKLSDYELNTDVSSNVASISVLSDEFDHITSDDLMDFAQNVVSGSSFSRVFIYSSGGYGICFFDDIAEMAVYGEIDESGEMSKILGDLLLYDDSYHYTARILKLSEYDLILEDVVNGSGDVILGECAYINISDEQLNSINSDDLIEFADNRVVDADYNWISIISESGKGICFSSCDILMPTYGYLDSNGAILDSIGTWKLTSGEYVYTESNVN